MSVMRERLDVRAGAGGAGGPPSVGVIGAGPGGLAAAMLAAASGCRVTVYEKQAQVGGRTGRVAARAADGSVYRFDMGPTFFLMPYVLDEVFAACGERLMDHAELVRLDPMYRLVIGREGGGPVVLDATQDILEMSRRIGSVNAADGRAFLRFVADQRVKLRLSEPILRRAMRSIGDLANGESLRVLPMLKPHKSVHGLLGEYFEDEHVKLAVSFQSKYLGMSPFECPSLFTILPLIEYEYGVWHPMGGCGALCGAMARVLEGMARETGGALRLGSAVESIEFEGTRAVGVVSGGELERHDAVVVNADATHAMKSLIPARLRASGPRAGYSDQRLDAKRYSCSTFMLYLGVEGEVDLPHHTIHTSASYRENLLDITSRGRLSEDPSIYVCNPSRTDPTLAPEGCSSLYVLIPTPNCRPGTDASAIDWAAEAPGLRARALGQLERVLGLGGIESRVRAEAMITPAGWAAMGINHGATFNLAHNLGQMLHWRPQNRLKGFDRLYLVGGGTHPGSGLPTIFLSAQISARLMCEDLGIGCALDHARTAHGAVAAV